MSEQTPDTLVHSKPIEIILHDATGEPVKTYRRSIIPWGIMKKALRLGTLMEKKGDAITEADMDAISDFVVDVFGRQFTREELEDGAKTSDLLAVMQGVLARVSQTINPIKPPPPEFSRKTKKTVSGS